jgi:hypothetical protein
LEERRRDLQATSVFGSVLCGALVGSIFTGLMLLKLEIIPSGDKQDQMTFEGLASIMLGVAAIVVGIVLPLAGIFAFVFLQKDVVHKAELFLSNEIEKGKFREQVESAINSALKDDGGVLRQYMSSAVSDAVDAKIAARQIENQNAKSQVEPSPISASRNKIEWGNEADEHGDLPRSKGTIS